MPEDIIADDEVISQDDIDKLLNASVNDEDNEGNETNTDPGVTAPADDTLAELSQDDIDNLLSGGHLGSDSLTEEPYDNDNSNAELNKNGETEDSDEFDLISQNDIDNLMDGIQKTEEPVPFDTAPDTKTDGYDEEDDDDEDLELISQEDISKLMKDAEKKDIDTEKEKSNTEAEDTDILELVSQDDIDKLMNQGPEDDDGESREVNAEKISDSRDKEEILDESDALDIEDCLITQAAIDQLMREDIESADSISDNTKDNESESGQDIDKNFEEKNDDESQIIPEIIKPDDEDDDTETQNVSESDIEDNLQGPPDIIDEKNEENSNLISQDDIDALLQGSEEEDEDILGDIDENSGSSGSNDQASESDQSMDISEKDNQIVIEESEETDNVESMDSILSVDEVETGKKNKHEKKWYKSKLLAAGFGTVFLMLSLGAGYYFFFYGPSLKAGLHSKAVRGQLNSKIDVKSGNLNANLSAFPEIIVNHGPGTIVMKDFIVLSPVKNKKLIYLNADISVHYSKGQALDEIKKHLPFYRGVIYDAIEELLQPGQKKEISEKNLSKVIKKALNQVMPEKYIDQVFFTSFKTG